MFRGAGWEPQPSEGSVSEVPWLYFCHILLDKTRRWPSQDSRREAKAPVLDGRFCRVCGHLASTTLCQASCLLNAHGEAAVTVGLPCTLITAELSRRGFASCPPRPAAVWPWKQFGLAVPFRPRVLHDGAIVPARPGRCPHQRGPMRRRGPRLALAVPGTAARMGRDGSTWDTEPRS